jgi:hypothetical protein
MVRIGLEKKVSGWRIVARLVVSKPIPSLDGVV